MARWCRIRWWGFASSLHRQLGEVTTAVARTTAGGAAQRNLSAAAKHTAHDFITLLANLSENFIFFLVGANIAIEVAPRSLSLTLFVSLSLLSLFLSVSFSLFFSFSLSLSLSLSAVSP